MIYDNVYAIAPVVAVYLFLAAVFFAVVAFWIWVTDRRTRPTIIDNILGDNHDED